MVKKKKSSEKRFQSEKRIDDLEKKISQLRARKAAEEAKLKQQARKDETRRKILVGSYFLNEFEKDDAMPDLHRIMDGFLTRENDRDLFGLPPLEN